MKTVGYRSLYFNLLRNENTSQLKPYYLRYVSVAFCDQISILKHKMHSVLFMKYIGGCFDVQAVKTKTDVVIIR